MNRLFHPSTDHAGWPEREIKIDASGFTVFEAGDPAGTRCTWADVVEVFAYKIDLFSYDEICVGFRFDGAGNHWWVGESYTGYTDLLEELPRRFPGIRTDWFSEVTHPAFATNRTIIWGQLAAPMTFAVDAEHLRRKPWWKLWA
jgi:hypothetical protein